MLARLFHFGAAVPGKMQGEEQPILIVEESRINFVLHDSRLAAELRAPVRKLHRLTLLVFPLIGDLVGLGLPDPTSRNFYLAQICVEGVADRLDLAKRIEAVGLGNLIGDWRALLRPGGCSKDRHPQDQKADHPNMACISHSVPSSVN